MPRHTRLGPVTGRWAEVDLLGERHWVHKRFHDQIAAADSEGGFRLLHHGTGLEEEGVDLAVMGRTTVTSSVRFVVCPEG
jgi:hypothetical protein